MVDHLQSRVTPWLQYASHVKVRGTLSKMDTQVHHAGDSHSSLKFEYFLLLSGNPQQNTSAFGGNGKSGWN